ncbi:armadillo-type fold [Trichococcus collinsii]|uniref:Armadillo-type fold n=2 Tax=Trichococcus collinsii TaxID=157076 RepID=A0AB38A068_9LACT|nr:armadillo-type fold [Trichococcus collinsii]SEA46950.1 hypothetical protein SAMN04488525_103166 [Trichococcus collinsii]
MIWMEQKEKNQLLEKIQGKPDLEAFVSEVLRQPEYVAELFAIIKSDPGKAKFYCDKVIRIVSERKPECIYPYFDEVAALIESPNSFIKWGAIITLANLAAVDTENKFASIQEQYFGLIADEAMVTAANVIGNAWKIILNKPEYEQDITKRLLQIPENSYLYKGEASPECRNILCGHAIDCFDKYFELAHDKNGILVFASGQTHNPRKQVAKKATAFLKKHMQ